MIKTVLLGMGVFFFLVVNQRGFVVRYANESKNLVGELEAALIAAKQALELDCTRLIIVYDCESIETLATG